MGITDYFDGIVYELDGCAYSSYGAKWYLFDKGFSQNDAERYLLWLEKVYFDKLRKSE